MRSLLVLRRFGVVVKRRADPGQLERPEAKRLRFSIRGMMIVTAAVALLCTEATTLQAFQVPRLFLSLACVICFVAVGLDSLWAALGYACPSRRVSAVFVISLGLGCYLAAPAHTAGRVYIFLIMVLYPAALMGSLLIVRSCGYRLVHRASPECIHLQNSAPARLPPD
jgi:hypothetical protein